MLPRRLVAVRPLTNSLRVIPRQTASFKQIRCASVEADPEVTDPNMNGGYINPPPGKRALRDPYGDWWDKQERRNFGEPVHEDNDIYAIFTTDVYNHATPGKAGLHFATFVLGALGLCGAVYSLYPDRASTPRTYPDGLAAELGGEGALTARKPGDDEV